MIYTTLVGRQGTGWALSEVLLPGLGREAALVMLGCAGPGWDVASDPLSHWWPTEEPAGPRWCQGFLQQVMATGSA